MATIVIADDGIPFNGRTPEEGPLGGAESAVVSLANKLATRGHEVTVFTATQEEVFHRGVKWLPISGELPRFASLYIANRSDKLIPLLPDAMARVFWIHNPAEYLLKFRYLWKLFKWKPTIIFSGAFHAKTCPVWVPEGGRRVIPYGITDIFLDTKRKCIAPPVALFTSNPLRSLSWLLDVWVEKIHPLSPAAELHIYSGPETYGSFGLTRAGAMNKVIEKAHSCEKFGVKVLSPVKKSKLAKVYSNARVMLYRGDPGETFCLAIAEAQAVGVPAVIQNIGCVAERIIDGKTGFVTSDDTSFANKASALLNDDELWWQQCRTALEEQRSWSWDEAAKAFESLIV
ncbi:MAG: hypothetical protein CMM44_09550 [Rhodospirillaceae bacterium]|nr:hypothetical protein [Rhodospirillaceae bacterium]